jgi:hypothetical protein
VQYVALSYTWDDGTNESQNFQHLALNGTALALPIRENLWRAIRVVGGEIMQKDMYLWVDAVCVNQDDFSERNSQLLLMPDIYLGAIFVAIWLGEESEDTPGAKQQITDLANHLVNLDLTLGSTARLSIGDRYASAASHISPDDGICSDAAKSQAIWDILNRPWFSRAGIAQEVTGAQERRFYYGDGWIPWEVLALNSEVAHKLAHFDATKTKPNPFTILDKITKWRKGNIKTRRHLLDLLGELRVYDCTDPRDKIYAIAGLASDLKLGYEPGDIIPNYAISVERVYIDFAATSLLSAPQGHELDILGHVIRGSPDDENLKHITETLPSWVPDWRTKLSIYPFSKYQINIQTDEIQGPVYHASKDTKFTGSIISGHHLRVRGFVISSIGFLSSPSFVSETSKREPYERLAKSWMAQNHTPLYNSSTTFEQKFLQTIIANAMDGSEAISHIRPPDFDWNASGIVEAMRKATYGRRFMQTTDWHMGLVPAAARVGDEICVFFGGQVLYVMRERKRSGAWEFIGECYVDHMMDGRAYQNNIERARDFIIT